MLKQNTQVIKYVSASVYEYFSDATTCEETQRQWILGRQKIKIVASHLFARRHQQTPGTLGDIFRELKKLAKIVASQLLQMNDTVHI